MSNDQPKYTVIIYKLPSYGYRVNIIGKHNIYSDYEVTMTYWGAKLKARLMVRKLRKGTAEPVKIEAYEL